MPSGINYKVYIKNMNEMSETSLETTLNAVENVQCVLICISEKYRQSNFCQAVCSYAFHQDKMITPLIMQEGYEKPMGWLENIMGNGQYNVNFTKCSLDECVGKLNVILLNFFKF